MKDLLNRIRKPTRVSISRKILYSTLVLVFGIILGIVSKALDETASNLLPSFLQMLDLRNFFSHMGIWIFLAVLISLYSKSPIRAAINVFLFFVGMVSSYYIYTIKIAGFFPKSYMMIWVTMTFISPIMASICWYAKGKGSVALFISSIIVTFISRQAFAFGLWYFDITNILELILWIATILVLYQSPKQIIKVVGIGVALFFLTSQMDLFWGIL
ncbi:MAG: hypothetical protein GX352_00530 [Clostridiales bacterium]|nr:hypothetical protein [Clostridiales bacterium]